MIHINEINRLCMGCHKLMAEPGGRCEHCGYDNTTPAAPHHLPPYTILAGKYMTGRVLGEGGFGITYLGFDLNLQIKVAIKEYYPSGNVSRETTRSNAVYPSATADATGRYQAGLDRFLSEARAVARFHNLNGIVEVRDFFRENGTAYIVMEFIEGITLARELKDRGRIPANEVLARFEPMIRSLSQVHKEGVIHRDISPDNIISTPNGELKLLDFGAARDMEAQAKSVSIMLKPGYAPEEQYRMSGEQGPWTDCYALSATLYKLMTGVTPQESLERLAEDKLIPPSQLGAELTPLQEKAILMGMSVKAEDRFKSVDALYNALYAQGLPTYEKVTAAQPQPKSTVQNHAYSPQKKRSKAPLILAVVFAVLAVAAVCLYFFVLKTPKEPLQANVTPTPTEQMQPQQTDTPDTGSLTEGFRTPEPEAQTESLPVFDSEAGTISLPAFSAFTGAERIRMEEAEEATVYYFAYEPMAAAEYVAMLETLGEYEIDKSDTGSFSFFVEQDGIRVSLSKIGESLAVCVPGGVSIEEYDAGVDYRYLTNNGLSFAEWKNINKDGYHSKGSNYRGNTTANIMNASCVAMQGDTLYYSEYTDTGYLYSQPLAGGRSKLLLETGMYAMHLGVSGEYLYFTAFSEEDGFRSIYRYPLDGSSNEAELLRENATMPMLMGDYICFKSLEDNSLMWMHTDGSNAEVLCGGENYFINVMGDAVYTCDTDRGIGLYAVEPTSREQQLIMDHDLYFVMIYGGRMFYVADEGYDYALFRCDMASGDMKYISDIVAESVNTDGKRLYLATEGGELYSMTMDGEDVVLLAEGASNPMVICDGSTTRLFYLANGDMDLMEYDFHSGEASVFRP